MFVQRQPDLPPVSKEKIVHNEDKKETLLLSSTENEIIPSEFAQQLNKKIISPVKKNLTIYFDKMRELGKENQIKASIAIVKNNHKKIIDAIDSIKVMEAQESIADLDLAGFDAVVKLNLEGIQVNISSGENRDVFYDIVRRYILKYDGVSWPPPIHKIGYFIKGDDESKLCCYYWPLYGYIQTLFQDGFRSQMNLTDIFSLNKMQKYCKDTFSRNQQKDTNKGKNQGKHNKNKKGGNPPNPNPNPNPKPFKKFQPQQQQPQQGQFGQQQGQFGQQQGQFGQQKGQFGQQKGQFGQQKGQFGQQQQQKPGQQGQQQQQKPGQQGQQQQKGQQGQQGQKFQEDFSAVASFAKNCIPPKINRIIGTLSRNNIVWDKGGEKFVISEWSALQQIVSSYVKKLKNTDLIKGGVSAESFVESQIRERVLTEEEIKQRKKENLSPWQKEEIKYTNFINKMSNDVSVVIDPIMKIPYTYGNLVDWFGYHILKYKVEEKGKDGKKKFKEAVEKYKNPVSVIKNALNCFKSQYKLPSPMFMLDNAKLEGVRRRLLKFLLEIFTQLERSYSDIIKKVETVKSDNKNRQNVIEKLKNLMVNLNNAISQETDPVKKEKLIKLKQVANEKFGSLVREYGTQEKVIER
jgi:hypothetical protein